MSRCLPLPWSAARQQSSSRPWLKHFGSQGIIGVLAIGRGTFMIVMVVRPLCCLMNANKHSLKSD